MSDDAHGIGVVGGGRGSTFAGAAPADVPLQMGTLSKAIGGYGGYLCASRPVIDLMHNRARTPDLFDRPAARDGRGRDRRARPDRSAIRPMRRVPLAKARAFTRRAGLPEAQSPIVPIVLGERRGGARGAAAGSRQEGFLVVAIRPPTVPDGTARLRLAFTAGHPDAEIERLADLVRERRARMSADFVTATGTDIGKTFVARGLIGALRARRPRGRGAQAGRVRVRSGRGGGQRQRAAARRARPPGHAGNDRRDLALAFRRPARRPTWRRRARAATLDMRELIRFCHAAIAAEPGVLLIEGVGGADEPGQRRAHRARLDVALGLPVILVAGSYLGTISHTLTALDVLARRSLEVAARGGQRDRRQPGPAGRDVRHAGPFCIAA